MDKIIHSTPNWMFEAAACIVEQYINSDSSFMENHNKFGMTRDEMDRYMKNYITYKEAVTSEIMPIYKEYPSLEKIFSDTNFSAEINNSLVLPLVMYFGTEFSCSMEHKDIDRVINRFLEGIIEDLLSSPDEGRTTINNIEDLLSLLDKSSLEDRKKIQLISLYHNRYGIVEKLSELLMLCVPVCQKHYSIIKQDFERAVKLLNETEDLEELLNSSNSIKIKIPQRGEIYSNIFCYNHFSMIDTDNKVKFYIGIYFFDYLNSKAKDVFDDEQLVADLKALGDQTRLRMMLLLVNKRMYVQELAEALELTPATVSHHISILLKSGLISVTLDGEKARKIYYEANAKKLEGLGNTIKGLSNIKLEGGNNLGE